MFDQKAKLDYALLGKTNRIIEGTKIHGNIESPVDMRIDGEVFGNISCEGKIVLGHNSKIQGDVVCKNIDVEGKFEGKLDVAELLTIRKTATIKGDVFASKLAVEPGAVFEASCEMRKLNS